MRGLVVSVLAVVLCVEIALAAEDIVVTKYGPVRGLIFPGFRQFQGVPYATPPLGKLRWKNPIPPSPWTEVKDCRHFDIGCAQSAHSMDVPKNTSEDCLYLEIFTPRVGKYKEPAAVMLWFYGGDFKEGGESFALYNGSYMASTTNTITVMTNYRVGNLGFLYTKKTDPNVGLADQRWTLQWIQENIAAFGGDPNKVTIFGQSAGGESVLIHMSSPNAPTAGLFHRAIVESGPIALTFKDTSAAYLLADVFAYYLGCDVDDLDCMQSKSTKEVLQAANSAFIVPLDWSEAIMKWAPVVTEDIYFPMNPIHAFEKGAIVNVPFMIGSNLDDGALFGYAINKDMPAYEYIGIVTGMFHDGWIPTILEAYPPVFFGNNTAICSKLITDYAFLCDSRRAVRLAEYHGNDATYYYQFTHLPPVCPWPDSQKYCCNLVCHGDEIPYVYFDSGNPYPWTFTGNDSSLASAMSNYWASFAHYGDPNKFNGPGVPTWPLYRAESDLSMQLDWPLKSVKGLNKKLCDMWDSVGYDNMSKFPQVYQKFKKH